MQIEESIKRTLSLTIVVTFIAYGFTRCVTYISYVSNFGLVSEPHGYISTIPFMFGASIGDVLAASGVFFCYVTGKLQPQTIPYKIPILAIIGTYTCTLIVPNAFAGNTAFFLLGLIWGAASTFASTAVIEFLAYESSPLVIVVSLAAGSLLTASVSILIRIYPHLAGPLDIVLAVVSLALIGVLRKKTNFNPVLNIPRKTISKTLRLAITPILASATFELVVGLINMFSFTGASSFQIETDSPILGMLLSGVAVTIFVTVAHRVPREQVVYSVIFPGVIGLILLIPFFGDVLGKAASTLLYSAYLFTSLLSMFCCIQACQKTHDSVYGIMSIFSIMLRLFLVVGLVLGWWLGSLQNAESFMQISLTCVVCIYLLGLVLVLRNVGKRFILQTSEPEMCALTSNTVDKIPEIPSSVSVVPSSSVDALEIRLDELTQLYGLTNRERDVLVGLAQGNTAAAIAKDLCLSTSTVQSYTKTLYAKLGINKKQQVIDLVMKSRET